MSDVSAESYYFEAYGNRADLNLNPWFSLFPCRLIFCSPFLKWVGYNFLKQVALQRLARILEVNTKVK